MSTMCISEPLYTLTLAYCFCRLGVNILCFVVVTVRISKSNEMYAGQSRDKKTTMDKSDGTVA